MLAKKYRLKRGEIEYLMRKGAQMSSKLFIVRQAENQESFSKYCVIISRKIEGKAVGRNKIRRRTQEAIRDLNREGLPKAHLNLVLIGKKNIKERDFREIKEDLKHIFTQMNNG